MSNGLHTQRTRLADLALVTYLAPVLAGRRVAVVGPASGDVARRARVLGAATVVAFGGTGEDIAVRALTPGALAAFHGKIDVVVVPDAGAVPSIVAVLDEARRALGSEGIVAVASQPEDAPTALEPGGKTGAGYHDLYELCAGRFASVRMVGRGPFVGYTVAALDEGPAGVALDTRLIDGDPPRPEAFIAVASDSVVSLDAMAVVQVPGEVLDGLRESATHAIAEELARRDQKLKEVEAASAERWVKIQRYEHGLKELEEETRKTRERAVRLSKELEDERKLRQRIELEAQMVRRAPELPKAPDLEPEVRRLREQLANAERDLGKARSETTAARHDAAAARTRIHDLERELDETQGVEADLRGQLDEMTERADALEAAKPEAAKPEDDEDFVRLERELRARAAEAIALRQDVAVRDQSIRELAYSLGAARENSVAPGAATAPEGARWQERFAEASKVHAALADQAEDIVADNVALNARVEMLEAQVVELGGEGQQQTWRAQELEAELARATDEHHSTVTALHARIAGLEGGFAGVSVRAAEHQHSAAELSRTLADERAARSHAHAETDDQHAELARLHALSAGLEARAVHVESQLEDARIGFRLRTTELEREIETLKAEAVTLANALREAEAVISTIPNPSIMPPALGSVFDDEVGEEDSASRFRMDQVLADLNATAERLAQMEEAYAQVQGQLASAVVEINTLRDVPPPSEELMLRAMAHEAQAQLLQRDDRLRVLVEALEARDAQITTFERQVVGEVSALKHALEEEARANRSLRGSLEVVRLGISAILIEGRGAVVAHDLVLLLRQIETNAP